MTRAQGAAAFRRRLAFLLGIGLAFVVAALALPPVRQYPSYHAFADHRTILGIPSFSNVVSNLPFVVVGIMGLAIIAARRSDATFESWERRAFALLFVSIAATGLGSAYYHLAPSDERLFWDRLPMTAGFSSLLAIVAGDRLGSQVGARLLVPLFALGILCAVYWRWTGDLRPYVLAQLLPLLFVPLLLALFPPRHSHTWLIVLALFAYAIAKVAELLDAQIYSLGGLVSGHTLKHLVASASTALLVGLARDRRPLLASSNVREN